MVYLCISSLIKETHFHFFIVRMPNKSSNIPNNTFYGSILSEFLRIARNTLLYADFLPRAKDLMSRMLKQGGERDIILKQVKKALSRHPDAFQNFPENVIISDLKNAT